MTDAIVFTAEPAETPRAAGWLARRLADAGLERERIASARQRLEQVWTDLLPLVFARGDGRHPVMLTVRGEAGEMRLELVGERRGRLPSDALTRAEALGTVAEPVRGVEGLTRMRFAV